MAQENANLCHAAIYFQAPPLAIQNPGIIVRAATGIDLASVKRRTDVQGIAIVYEFDLVDAIADEDLIVLVGQGPTKTNSGGLPPAPISNPIAVNVQRAIGDTTQRRFWVLMLSYDADVWIEFLSIPTLAEPLVLVP